MPSANFEAAAKAAKQLKAKPDNDDLLLVRLIVIKPLSHTNCLFQDCPITQLRLRASALRMAGEA